MSDIVERLRELEAWIRKPVGEAYNMNTDMFDDAADEITRLRADNERLLAANRDVMLHWNVLRDDYERLREAVSWLLSEYDAPNEIHEAVAKLRAALAAQPAPSGWRPIETAPKDKTRVIVAKYGAHSPLHEKAGDCWWACKAYFDGDCWTDGMDDLCTPTHWMPLPPAPGKEEA